MPKIAVVKLHLAFRYDSKDQGFRAVHINVGYGVFIDINL
jgi:hypothetical protein